MENIIKAQLYQMSRNKLVYLVIILISIVMSLETGGMDNLSDGCITGSDIVLCSSITIIASAAFLVSHVQCSDLHSSNINCDILSGVSRSKVFFGRYIAAMLVVLGLIILEGIIPTVIFTVINGWGDNIPLKSLPLRILPMAFLLLRASAEATLLAVISKSGIMTDAIALLVGIFELTKLSENENATVLRMLSSVGEYIYLEIPMERLQYMPDGSVTNIVEYAIPAAELAIVIGLSAAIWSICIIAAKKIFSRRDYK